MATYTYSNDIAKTIAAADASRQVLHVNMREEHFCSRGEYETLIRKLYSPNAAVTILDRGRSAEATGHNEIIEVMKKMRQGKTVKSCKLESLVVENDTIVADVLITFSDNLDELSYYFCYQIIHNGKFLRIIGKQMKP